MRVVKFYSSLVLLATLACLTTAADLNLWQQCGGIGWTGSGTCVQGSVCTYSSDYYSQCLPVATTQTTPPAGVTNPAASGSTAALWEKCGGIAYTGPTGCPSGSSCTYVNDWYYQCQPSSNTATNSAVTTTASTTTRSTTVAQTTTASSGSGGTASLWNKCGGIGYTGPTVCPSGSSCVIVNDWYHQCQPTTASTVAPSATSSSSTMTTTRSTIISTLTTSSTAAPTTQSTTVTSTTTSAASVTSSSIVNTVSLWSQCGGIGYTGATGCPSGSSCVYVNDWYHQCRPSSISSASPPSTSSTSSSSSSSSGGNGGVRSFSLNSTWLSGRAYSTSNNNYADFSHITIWLGSHEYFNIWWEGQMVRDCVAKSITPVFYSYIIAFSGRNLENLQDCDVSSGPNLCNRGAQFIRNNRAYLVAKYALFAANISIITGRDAVTVWLIEPDFYQYYSDSSQTGGTLSGEYMRALLDDFANAIKTYLPNAIISWDISPWAMQNMNTWWSFFSDAPYIQLTHTSGGRASATSNEIKQNELTYSAVRSITGKPILTDCGYGVGGSDLGNCGPWGVSSNIDARIQNGVIGVSQANVAFTPSYWPNLP